MCEETIQKARISNRIICDQLEFETPVDAGVFYFVPNGPIFIYGTIWLTKSIIRPTNFHAGSPTGPMNRQRVQAVRRFNRFYTRQIGVLQKGCSQFVVLE